MFDCKNDFAFLEILNLLKLWDKNFDFYILGDNELSGLSVTKKGKI